jgi:AcrR family transcriptional regulator
VFARRGYDGTHIRDVCTLAHINVAALCYYFHSKEDLYAAVQAEARQRLSCPPASTLLDPDGTGLQHRLETLIESLFAKLTTDSAWIARLLAREVADDTTTSPGAVGEGFHADLRLLESIIRDAVGPQADPRTLRLAALSVLSQCVFLCAAEPRLARLLPNSRQHSLTRQELAFYLANLSLRGLNSIARSPASHPRQRPQTDSSHYGMSQFKKWLRWMESHHHENTHKQSSQTAADDQ